MRALVAFALLLVGALMVPVATAGWWLRDTVVPQAAFVATDAPLASDEHVQDAVAEPDPDAALSAGGREDPVRQVVQAEAVLRHR